jgi:glycogen debranching enzyme
MPAPATDIAATKPADGAVNLTDTIVLKRDNAFCVSLRDGRIPFDDAAHPLGLYLDDCRFLSVHELHVGGARPRLLVASADLGCESVHELTNPDLRLSGGRRLPLQALQIRLERVLESPTRLRERVHIHHYGREPLELEVTLALGADFQGMLALRGIVALEPPSVRVERTADGVRFTARGRDGVERATTVSADPVPADAQAGLLRFALPLEPAADRDLVLTYELHDGAGAPPAVGRRAFARATPEDSGGETRVTTDDVLFDRIVRRSLLDMRMLRSTLDGDSYFAAGVPWFATLFGRDSLISALQMLAFDRDVAPATLRVLAARLGARRDPTREEEPGKVLHELRRGEVAALDLTPLARYYGSVDATPLFLCLLSEHADWSGDLSLLHELAPAVDAALAWIDEHGDHDGDGLLDYRASSPRGLRNQGWKDSEDGIVDERGLPLEPPIALVEAQGYVVRAKRGVARLLERAGDPERAARLREAADALAGRLERFWLEGRGCYAMALDGAGRPSGALASNQGHLLWARALDPRRAGAVRDALMSPAMFSGWGIRTLGRGEAGFNPVAYHRGTVWPHDTAMIAAGLRHYGFDTDFLTCFEALIEAASHAEDYRLPELFAGFSRTQFETPVPYPVACHPQAWAAAAVPYLLVRALGLEPDALEGRLRVHRPSLPAWLNRVRVDDLRVGSSRVGLTFERTSEGQVALTDARIDGDLEVVLAISATGATRPG